jgi:hypothetical protein
VPRTRANGRADLADDLEKSASQIVETRVGEITKRLRTVQHELFRPESTLIASTTASPDTIAFVVAIAGIMLPMFPGVSASRLQTSPVRTGDALDIKSRSVAREHVAVNMTVARSREARTHFVGILKMCERTFAAATTKSSASASSLSQSKAFPVATERCLLVAPKA